MSERQKGKIRLSSWLILFTFILIIYVGVPLISIWASREVVKPPVWPTYTPREVGAVCETVPILATHEFCTMSSGQNAVALNQLVNEVFPEDQSTYSDVITHLGGLKSNWGAGSECGRDFHFILNNCPAPQFCTDGTFYECSFELLEDLISIHVIFDMATGIVLHIYVPTPGDS